MAPPSQITVTYISTPPSTTATVTLPIPGALSLTALNSGPDAFDTLLGSLTRRGGITFTDASGVVTFIPMLQITKITAS